ncbi:hypothetical protein AtEden1_Chr5g0099311 [Arabidopsis thaliana]
MVFAACLLSFSRAESDLADPSKTEAFLSVFSPQTFEIPPEDPDLVLSFMRLSLFRVSGCWFYLTAHPCLGRVKGSF